MAINQITTSNDIIPVDYSNDRITVLARDLHQFLEVQTPYHKWFPRMCEYGFTENVDYSTMDKNVLRADGTLMPQKQRDAQLTIDMAKEICMLQRNERGKYARQYFLQLEKDWNSPELVMARALTMAQQQIETMKQQTNMLMLQNQELSEKIEQDKDKVDWANQCLESDTAIKVGDYAKLIYDKEHIKIGQNRLFRFLRDQHILDYQNVPYQEYIDRHWFKLSETPIQTSSGVIIKYTTKVTPEGEKGLLKVIRKHYAA